MKIKTPLVAFFFGALSCQAMFAPSSKKVACRAKKSSVSLSTGASLSLPTLFSPSDATLVDTAVQPHAPASEASSSISSPRSSGLPASSVNTLDSLTDDNFAVLSSKILSTATILTSSPKITASSFIHRSLRSYDVSAPSSSFVKSSDNLPVNNQAASSLPKFTASYSKSIFDSPNSMSSTFVRRPSRSFGVLPSSIQSFQTKLSDQSIVTSPTSSSSALSNLVPGFFTQTSVTSSSSSTSSSSRKSTATSSSKFASSSSGIQSTSTSVKSSLSIKISTTTKASNLSPATSTVTSTVLPPLTPINTPASSKTLVSSKSSSTTVAHFSTDQASSKTLVSGRSSSTTVTHFSTNPASSTSIQQVLSSSSSFNLPLPTDYPSTGTYYHNRHRLNHSAPLLTWDVNQALIAAEIASSCVFAHNMSVHGGNYGQNLAAYGSSGNVLAMDPKLLLARSITNQWYYGEVNDFLPSYYDLPTPNMVFFNLYGHFTQVVWRHTLAVGCATQYCPAGTIFGSLASWFTVCNYVPPGNFLGEFDINVFPPIGLPAILPL